MSASLPTDNAPRSDPSGLSRQVWGADSPNYHWWITAALMLGLMTAALSITVVNLAFPKIMTSLRADLDQMQWVQTGYMIVAAVMMPSVGWLGSHLGNRRLYVLSLGGFVGGSILCGMAWDVYSLIGFRLLQALCAGPLFPMTQVILFQTFPENKRGLAMGISSLGFSFGPMIGPVLGGYLLEYASWRSVFYINVPVGLLGLFLSYMILPKAEQQEKRSLDLVGMLTMATFLVSFLLAMSQGRTEGWDSPYIISLMVTAVIAGVSFVVVELRSRQPFVELRLYANLAFAMASIAVFINTLGFMASNFIIILFLQIHLEFSPLQAAWMMMPTAIVIGIISVYSGRLSDTVPAKVLVIGGLVMVTLCFWQYTTITSWTSMGMITFWLTARGFARGFTIAPLSAASLAPLKKNELRMGSALLSLNRGMASSASVALAATVFQNRLAERTILLVQDQSAAAFGQSAMLEELQTFFLRLGEFSDMASAKAMATLNRLVSLEAGLRTYHDMFILLALISAAGIIPALWMGNRQPEASIEDTSNQKPETETPSPTSLPSSVAVRNGMPNGALAPVPEPSKQATNGVPKSGVISSHTTY
jgi:DHA2 family multidrug resistance protein